MDYSFENATIEIEENFDAGAAIKALAASVTEKEKEGNADA